MGVLVRDGYEGLTMDAVAEAVHASKSTIYRRWTGKSDLVRAALDHHDRTFNAQLADTGDLRRDLLAVVDVLRRKAVQFPVAHFVELTDLMKHDEELAESIERHLAAAELSLLAEPLARAIARREICDTVDHQLLHAVVEAMVVHRLQLGRPLDDAFATQLVDDVVLRLIQAGTFA